MSGSSQRLSQCNVTQYALNIVWSHNYTTFGRFADNCRLVVIQLTKKYTNICICICIYFIYVKF